MSPTLLDDAEIERLYTRLERRVYNVVYRWVWNPEDAADIVQEAFVRLWRARHRVDADTVEAYVYRIAVNLASNRRRAKKLWGWVPLDPLKTRTPDDDGSEQRAVRGERDEAVRQAVLALPERLRRVVALTEFSELSYREVAAILDIPEGTVASRRNKAMTLLKERLAHEEAVHARA